MNTAIMRKFILPNYNLCHNLLKLRYVLYTFVYNNVIWASNNRKYYKYVVFLRKSYFNWSKLSSIIENLTKSSS